MWGLNKPYPTVAHETREDAAPEELVRLVKYLETISDQLVIDLITLSAYTVNGSQILVPQRVEAEPKRLGHRS